MKPHASAHLDVPPAAFLYERYAVPLLTYLRLHTPAPEDAEDILQEVFLATLVPGRLLSLPEQEQLAWLGGVARHKLADHYRRTWRRPALPLREISAQSAGDERLTPESVVLGREAQHELWEAVTHLSALQQQVVYLRFVGGLHCPQIASLLGKRESAVRKLLSRALNQLRDLYKRS